LFFEALLLCGSIRKPSLLVQTFLPLLLDLAHLDLRVSLPLLLGCPCFFALSEKNSLYRTLTDFLIFSADPNDALFGLVWKAANQSLVFDLLSFIKIYLSCPQTNFDL
jgi:hypothetical protein